MDSIIVVQSRHQETLSWEGVGMLPKRHPRAASQTDCRSLPDCRSTRSQLRTIPNSVCNLALSWTSHVSLCLFNCRSWNHFSGKYLDIPQICLSPHILMDIRVISTFYLLQMKLVWIVRYKSLNGCLNLSQINT